MKEIKVKYKGVLMTIKVDDWNYPNLSLIHWTINRVRDNYYAYNRASGIYMHNLILRPPNGMRADHINGDGLDNQRLNLRVCTDSQNGFNRGLNKNNTSGYKGVSYSNSKRLYEAKIAVNGKTIHLGRHSTPEEAARAYDEGAKQLVGKYAQLNFPQEKSC